MLKRKDDIRRRLTINEVPKPPDDLVHRIKRDIPKHFTSKTAKQVEKRSRETMPLWNFWGFSWQLAAGILVMVGLTWVVFEAWRSEVSRPAQIAESSAPTVEEFEAKVTGAPLPAPEAAPREAGTAFEKGGAVESNRFQVSAPAAAPPPPAAERDFAPEARRESAEAPAPQPQRAPVATSAATPAVDARESKDEAVGRAAGASTAGAPPPAPTLAAASTMGDEAASQAVVVAEAPASKLRTTPREVFVKGLAEDRIVRVELRLDSAGKVAEARVVVPVDDATRDAVSKAAKDWTFESEGVETRFKSLTRTIDVQLRREK